MIQVIDCRQRIPQGHELPLYPTVLLIVTGYRVVTLTPQVGIGTSVKERREQGLTEDGPDLFQHLGSEVITAQAVQVVQVLENLGGIVERLVDIVEVTDDELRPVDEFVKLLSLIAKHLTISIIQRKYHFDIGRSGSACELGDKLVDRRHTWQQMRLDA